MAFQARPRDPFLDSDMQAAIEKRGKELFGFGLLGLGVLFTLLLVSYVPEDPSWLSATDEPAKNWLGRPGASLASPLFVIVGFGAWAIPFVTVIWGLRFVLHRGTERAFSRLIFAPLCIALASVYASTHVPVSEWTHSFGLGGLFGDTVLGAVLGVVPISAAFGLKLLALIVFLAFIGLTLFVLGFDRDETRSIARFLLVGVILTYASIVRLFGATGRGVFRVARHANSRRIERQEVRLAARQEAEAYSDHYDDGKPVAGPSLRRAPVIHAPEPAPDLNVIAVHEPEMSVGTAPQKPGILGLVPSLLRGSNAGTPPEPPLSDQPLNEEDRIKSKISDVIKSRVGRGPQVMHITPTERAEPTLRREPILQANTTATQTETGLDDFDAGDDGSGLYEEVSFDQAPQAVPAYTRAAPTAPQKSVVQHPVPKAQVPSKKAAAEAQPTLFDSNSADFELPPLGLLSSPSTIQRHVLSDEALEENARMLEAVLDDYGVKGEIVSVRPGPVVTMYELEPAPGLKASRVIGLADDIARSMSALSARVSTVPGRSVIGIELPNEKREMVVLREILAGREFGDGNQKLPLALGKDIGGEPIVANLAKMPHLLIAGTTGSGKSVAINTMILSLLYKLTPEECRLIMIDPKMLELSVYDGIPHLLSPVVTDPKKAVVALKWVVGEMEERYRKMSKMGVRNIDGYNGRVADALSKNEMFTRTVQTGFDDETGEPIFETEEFAPEKMPYIVVIVDEMADLMMVAGKEIEACIQRLAQMARASGIHLIMATQRPSVDVITGTIKANFPTRISFQVTSKIDSRTILGEMGAEQLLGMGDMLYMAGGSKITRVHGPFVSDEEVEEIVNHLKSFGPPSYMSGVVDGPDEEKSSDIDIVLGLGGNTDGEDALYDTAVQIVIKDRKCSTSYIQRKLAIGYNKAARLVEQMEDAGLVSAANHVGKREILVPEQ